MKRASLNRKTVRQNPSLLQDHTGSGPNGVSLASPAYGIDFLDRQHPNQTGLPDRLKSGVEALSGISMDNVKVHYNSSRPAELTALAIAQGNNIHIARGQERHLPHEAWHVVQQAQGRVAATRQSAGAAAISDDPALEREAERMGAQAASVTIAPSLPTVGIDQSRSPVVQRMTGGEKGKEPENEGTQVIQRKEYESMAALLEDAVGYDVFADIAQYDPVLRALITDAEQQLEYTDVIAEEEYEGDPQVTKRQGGGAGQRPFYIEYNPNPQDDALLASYLLHELLHVSAERNYQRGGAAGSGLGLDWLNLNLPTGLAGTDEAIIAEIETQISVLGQNLSDLEEIAKVDSLISNEMWSHVKIRLELSGGQPAVHYETVLADLIAYMELNNVRTGPTHDFIRRLIKESTDRRLVAPWWGIKRARRVDPNARWFQFWKW